MKLMRDVNNNVVQGWVASSGKTIPIGAYTPLVDEMTTLGVDVTITLNGAAVPYTAGSTYGMRAGSTHTFSIETPIHLL